MKLLFSQTKQLVVVVSSDWNATEGQLFCFQRLKSNASWTLGLNPVHITLGKQGMAWGRGLENFSDQGALRKKEGDSRSPAGAFLLGPAFGNAFHASYAKNMDFIQIKDDLECIDDPHSSYYNQFVFSGMMEKKEWKSSEKMHEVGPMYDLGICIQHNSNPVQAGMGSAIFIHTWRNEGAPTAGCTAMKKEHLEGLAKWLNREASPCLVQLPIKEYSKKKILWDLPNIYL